MNKISRILDIIKSKSIRYLAFRSTYELERKSGLLARKFPTNPKNVFLPSLEKWRESKSRYLFNGRESILVPKETSKELHNDTQKILQGQIRFFSDKWYNLGLDYDWVTNPLTGWHYDIHQHWTKINDYSQDAGDIKFCWEPSRFCWLYTIIRNDYHNEEDHSEFVISRILDWINKNPLNCGPNYKCSQEISLRVLNWIFALYFYKNSPSLTNEAWNKIIQSVYWQIHHVYNNINFSRIAVRNNHAITETLTLYLIGLLFPEFPDADKWRKNGKKWFEQEIEYQFEPDGCYLQQSMNYQRVVTQLLTHGISLAHLNGERFAQVVYDRACANLNFLYQMQDEHSGLLPNYGANDGALFFPLNNADYCDYRPQLDALSVVLTGRSLYDTQQEDAYWYNASAQLNYPTLSKKKGIIAFNSSGYYLVKDDDSTLFIRCGKFKGACSADQLHIDLWKNGENLLIDAGSYLYNTDFETMRYFGGTEGHNTIMLEDNDQMKKGPRFIWTHPSDILSVKLSENNDWYELSFRIKTFKYLHGGHEITRTIIKRKNSSEITIKDSVNPKSSHIMRQIWHTTMPEKLAFVSNGERIEKDGAYSRYYGRKEQAQQIEFTSKEQIITTTISY